MAGESRTELLGWINDLLQLNYTKVRLELLSTPSMLLLLSRTQLSPRSNNAVNSLSCSPCPHSTVDTDLPLVNYRHRCSLLSNIRFNLSRLTHESSKIRCEKSRVFDKL